MIWSITTHPYPLLADVAEALYQNEMMVIKEYNISVDPSDICNFFGPNYIKEIKKLRPSVVVKNEKIFTFDKDKYLVNPFLNDLEQYLARCSIQETYKEEKMNDLQLLASLAVDPRDLYLRSFSYRSKNEKWTISHRAFIDLVKDHAAISERWSFNSWRPGHKYLYYGSSEEGRCYKYEDINVDSLPSYLDLKDLLNAAKQYMKL